MSDDIYDVDDRDVVQSNEIGDPGPGVFAPDAHRLAGLSATHHHDAEHGLPDTAVTIAADSSGLPLSCSHAGRSYATGEAAVVPATVARFWVRSGWATTESDTGAASDGLSEDVDEPGASVVPPVKSPARSRSAAAGSGRRTAKR